MRYAGLTLAAVLVSAPAAAQTVEDRVRDLEERLRHLEESSGGEVPLRASWKEGLRLAAPDGSYAFSLGGRLQQDWAWISEDRDLRAALGDQEDGAELRRAYVHTAGTLRRRIEFRAEYDFAGGAANIVDTYVGIKDVAGVDSLKAGHFKEPYSLEELTNDNYILFLERGLPSAFNPVRNLGLMAQDAVAGGRATWALGAFRDTTAAAGAPSPRDEGDYAVTGRLTGLALWTEEGRRYLHLGVAASSRSNTDGTVRYRARPEANVADRLADTGNLASDQVWLDGLEAALVWGPCSLMVERMAAWVERDGATDPKLDGWYVAGGCFLTGEHHPYRQSNGSLDRVRPRRPWGQDGGWGALEAVARYSRLDLAEAGPTAGTLDDVTLGLNWHLDAQCRVMADYVMADREPAGEAEVAEMRVQVDF